LKSKECLTAVPKEGMKNAKIPSTSGKLGEESVFGRTHDTIKVICSKKPYVFSNESFMVVGIIEDDGQYFETIMKKEEDRGEQSSNFVLYKEEKQYLNEMLINNDEPKEKTTFSLHTNCVHEAKQR